MNQAIPQQFNVAGRFLKVFLFLTFCSVTVFAAAWLSTQNLDPYSKNVLSLTGDREKGELIFATNCAACHGLKANGIVGPSLHNVPKRKTKRGLIEQVTSGETPPMPMFKPSPQEMADLLVYLQYL